MGNDTMNQKEILAIVRDFEQNARAEYGIVRIGIFGSVARNQFTEGSDVDIVVELTEPDLFTLAGIARNLRGMLNREVDIVRYRENMNPILKARIDRDAIYV